MKNTDIVLVGVGGQGTLLASKILGALDTGMDVKVSEVHGMSQRGGSVITYVRIGEDIHSPLVDTASADYVIAFELMEAVRALPYLKKGGTVITSTQRISPMPVVTGSVAYPDDLMDILKEKANVIALDAFRMAEEVGEVRAVNLVLLGALCKIFGAGKELFVKSIEACVPARLLEVNLKAFEAGYAAV